MDRWAGVADGGLGGGGLLDGVPGAAVLPARLAPPRAPPQR